VNVATIVSIAAIFISLCSLGTLVFQNRQLSRSTRSNTYNQIVDQNLHLNALLISLERSAVDAIFGNKRTDDVDEEDLHKARVVAASLIDHYENVFIQNRLGNVPASVWPGWEAYMAKRILRYPLVASVWREMRPTMDAGFVAYVDSHERAAGG